MSPLECPALVGVEMKIPQRVYSGTDSRTLDEAAVSRREYAMLTTRPADLLAADQRYAPPDTG